MASLFIPLQLTPGIPGVYLKPVCGVNELRVEDLGTVTAIDLLQGLLSVVDARASGDKASGDRASDDSASDDKVFNIMVADDHTSDNKTSEKGFDVSKIVTADRDRILAHLYISVYGSKVESTLSCEACEKQFDLDFSLHDLLNHYRIEPGLQVKDGVYQVESGSSFKLPTGRDEVLAASYSQNDAEDFLITRCLIKGDVVKDREAVQTKMAEMAPVLNIVMEAACPECSHKSQVQFDIQSFLLMKLKGERSNLLREVHCIARQYHWTHEAILTLPRKLRKQYVALIESDY